jgi:hypothetical protein
VGGSRAHTYTQSKPENFPPPRQYIKEPLTPKERDHPLSIHLFVYAK